MGKARLRWVFRLLTAGVSSLQPWNTYVLHLSGSKRERHLAHDQWPTREAEVPRRITVRTKLPVVDAKSNKGTGSTEARQEVDASAKEPQYPMAQPPFAQGGRNIVYASHPFRRSKLWLLSDELLQPVGSTSSSRLFLLQHPKIDQIFNVAKGRSRRSFR